jgi:hypothetical protein
MMDASHPLLSGTAIKCRGLYVPHRNIDAALARSIRPLIFENDTPDYLYSRCGSCTLIEFNGEFFCLLTKHQHQGFALASIRIMKGFFGGASLAFDSFFSVEDSGGEEFEDVCALKIARSFHRTKLELNDFFPLDSTEPPIENSCLLALLWQILRGNEALGIPESRLQ